MKKLFLTTLKISIIFLALTIITGGFFGLIGLGIFGAKTLVASAGIKLGFAAAAGSVIQDTVDTANTDTASPDLLLNTFDKKITLIRPDLYPLDTIIREMGIIVPIKSWETDYFAVESRGVADTIKTAYTTAVDTAAWSLKDIIVTNIHIWQVDDNVFFQGTTGTDGKEITGNVVSKDVALNKITIFILNGTGANNSDLPDLAIGAKLTRIGNSKSELDAQTEAYAVMPNMSNNFVQIHMAQVEQGLYAKLHDEKVQWNMADFRSEALYDLRRRMELTSLVGMKGYGFDSVGGDYKYFSGGVVRSISKALNYTSTTIDNDTYIGWTKDIFTGNNGSDTRVLFAGSDLMKYMSAVPQVNKQLIGENVVVKWGLKFNQIVTNFGILLVKHHQALTDIGYNEKGIVLDMQNIEKHVFKSLETRSIDLIGSGQKLADADVVSEAFCLVVKNPDTHALIQKT